MTPAKYAAFRTMVTACSMAAVRNSSHPDGTFPVDSSMVMVCWFYFLRPPSRPASALMNVKPDGTNLMKGSEDACQSWVRDGVRVGGVYTNDSRIVSGAYHKRYGLREETVIRIWRIM